jgi:hypothetical protein
MKSITGGVAKCEVAKTGDPGTQPTRVAQVSRLRPGVIACKQSAQKANSKLADLRAPAGLPVPVPVMCGGDCDAFL